MQNEKCKMQSDSTVTRKLCKEKQIKIAQFVLNRCLKVVMISLVLSGSAGYSQVFKTKDRALAEAFAKCDTVVRKSLFLNDEDVEKVEKSTKAALGSKIVTYYVGMADDSTAGYAFFETNIVRSKPETFMVVLNRDASVNYVELLAFYEPFDYLPTANWLELFCGQKLDDSLWPKKDIAAISGATLTVNAITRGVRTMIALYQTAIATQEQQP